MLGEGVGEIVLHLKLAIVIVAGQIKSLPELAHTHDLNFRRTLKNCMPLASLALDERSDFVYLTSQNRCQRENTADSLIYEFLAVAKGIERFRLSVPTGEPLGMVACSQASNAEVIGRRKLVVVVAEKSKEILKLCMRTLQGMQIGHTITSRE